MPGSLTAQTRRPLRVALAALCALLFLGGTAATAQADQGLLAVGSEHACVVRSSGHVACWGKNAHGQLGDRSTTDRSTPVIVADVDDAKAVSVNKDWSCALRTDGRVLCWGDISPPSDIARPPGYAVQVDGLSDAATIGVGRFEACAVRATGSFWCWSNGNRVENMVAGSVRPSPRDFVTATVAGSSVCGVRRTGTWHCQYGADLPFVSSTTWPSPEAVRRVSMDDLSSPCTLDVAGTVACQGRYPGNGTYATPDPNFSAVIPVPGLSNIVQIARTGGATCAVGADGRLWCWGPDGVDQLGDGAESPDGVRSGDASDQKLSPVLVPGVTDAQEVAASSTQTCLLRRTGAVDCWGQEPVVPTGRLLQPDAPVTGLGGVAAIGVGDRTSCAVRAAGTVACWGKRSRGGSDRAPVDLSGITDARRVAIGNYDGRNARCLLRGAGTVTCWGGPIPLSHPVSRAGGEPVGGWDGQGERADILGITDATDVAVGGYQACALRPGGKVTCWGRNNDGQVDPSISDHWVLPRDVPGIADATAIGAGDRFTCALRAGGKVWCWGFGERGRTGGAGEKAPHQVPGIANAKSIKIGAGGGCALIGDGSVRCWGLGTAGQLGNGELKDSTTAVKVDGIENATAIGTGEQFACAIRASGKTSCWGKGWYGVLGDGHTTLDQPKPVDVVGLTDAIAIDGGQNHVCATRSNHTVICWGVRDHGQLGDGVLGPVRKLEHR